MDIGINARLTPSDYTGVDMTPVRELRRAHEARQVRAKDQSDSGNISRGQQSVQQETERLERASKKLETAGRVVHQVVDLLQDTLIGLRLNRKELRPTSANQQLLQSADETANDIVGFARFDEEALFPPNTSPIKFEYEVVNESTGAVCTEGYTWHVFASGDPLKAIAIPEDARALLQRDPSQYDRLEQ